MGTHRALRGGGTVDDTAFLESSAYVNGSAVIGARSYLGHGVYVDAGVIVGSDCIICDRVRVTSNVPDGTTILCDCCDGSGGGGTIPVLTFDSINVVGDKLAAYVTTGKLKGTLAYVGNDTYPGQRSVHAYFVLVYGEALAADGITVVDSPTFGVDGAQWLRQDTVDNAVLQGAFFAVDPANVSGVASDENDGMGANLAAARLVPLRSYDELDRRNFGRNGYAQIQIAAMSDDTQTPVMHNFAGRNGSDQPAIIGDLVQFGGDYVVSAYLTEIPASNLSFILDAPGIGAVGNLGKLVTNAAQTVWAMIDSVDGADGCTVLKPHNYNPLSFSGTLNAAFTPGETVRIWTMPLLTQWPFPGDSSYPTAWHCRIVRQAGTFDLTDFGSSSPQVTACSIGSLSTRAGNNLNLTGCLFQGGDSILNSTSNGNVYNSGTLDSDVYVFSGNIGIYNTFCVRGNGATLYSARGAAIVFGAGAHLAGFNSTVDVCEVQPGSSLYMSPTSAVYGNIGPHQYVKVWPGASAAIAKALCYGLTSGPKPLEVASVLYNYDDLPIAASLDAAFLAST